MSNRVVETIYRLRDQATEVLRRIRGGYQGSATEAERASRRIEAANRRQQSSLQGVLSKVGRLRFAYFAVAGAVAGAVRGIASFARAASDQANAVRRLETALKNGKGATDEQIQALKDQAKELQRVTRFGDEATISAQAQLATFQLNADAIAAITPRALDLAEGMRRLGKENVDVEQAAILLGKALRGNAGDLSRYGVVLTDAQRELINFGSEQEKVAALAEAIDANYKGLAESLTPYEQAVQRASNGIGDFVEKLGAFITESPAVTEAIDGITNGFENLAQKIQSSTAGINRFIKGTVASFRVLGNTAQIIFDGILLGANRMTRSVIQTARNVAENLSRITFGSAKESLNQFVREADQRLADLEKSSEQRFEKIGKNAAEFIDAGRDLSDALQGQASAQREVNKVTDEASEKTEQQIRAEQRKQEAIERTRSTLEEFGVDVSKVETGVSNAAKQTTQSLQQLAADGQVSLEVLSDAAARATEGFTTKEIESFRQQLDMAVKVGQVGRDQFEALTGALGGVKESAGSAESEFNRLNTAIVEANNHDLTNIASEIRELGEAGKLSAGEVDKLRAAIEAKRQAQLGANDEQDANTESTRQSTQAMQGNAEAAEESAGRMTRLGGSIQLAAAAQGVFNQRLAEWQGGGTARYIQFWKRSLEEALEVSQRIGEVESRLNRLRAQGVAITDASAASNQELRFQLMELRGEQERVEEQRRRAQKEELRLQIELAQARGDEEELELLRERQQLLRQIENERERQERQEKQNRRQKKNDSKSANEEADAAERSADAAERESRARRAGGVSRSDEIRLRVDVNQAGQLQFNNQQFNDLAARIIKFIGDDGERT